MDKLYWLNEIKPSHRTQVGDKALNLSIMMQHGYSVIPGFVIAANILHEYLEKDLASQTLVAELANSSLHLDVDNWRQLQQVALHLRQEIISSNLSESLINTINLAVKSWETPYLIFRPTVALPYDLDNRENISGLYESVFCRNEEKEIALALKRIWSQLFSAKSLLYWHKSKIDLRSINLGVLVQPVNNIIASGCLNANSSRWEIQATWGLGVAINWGEVQPDVYYVEPKTGTLSEQHLGNKILAYRCENAAINEAYWEHRQTSVMTVERTCLQVCILEEEKQQQYVLSEPQLQQITELAGKFVGQLGEEYSVNWTFIQEADSIKLYLTKVSKPININRLSRNSLIKGIGAATGQQQGNVLIIENSQQIIEQLPKGIILVASVITPDWLPVLQQVGGFITEKGGLTSHAAIIARELGIPAVVGVNKVTKLFQNGDRILIDGDSGEIHQLAKDTGEEHIHNLNMEDVSTSCARATEYPPWVSSLPSIPHTSISLPMTTTQLLVNLSQPTMIDKALSFPVDGVGLLRSELMVLSILNRQNPYTWIKDGRGEELLDLWTKKILDFVRAFSPRPVYYRSLDWRTQELPSLHHGGVEAAEPQTALGQRGTFSYLLNSDVFDMELTALSHVQHAGYHNIRLILPFVRTVEEFAFCRRKVEQAGLTDIAEFQLWIMAEVPSVLFLLPEYVKAGVQGISIGTNDLTQLLLGVDRDQAVLAKSFDEHHPVVMDAISRLIEMARKAGIPCSICGQAPALYPEIITKLVEWGITSISVEPEALQRTYQAILRAEQSLLLEAARRQLR
ncbi:phosphoenolpyruvate synthase [Plectonema cf. radiosum LEGE 06105]|uniref:Phosphoenolpyruvate synthase n=1 Tax=Plectonema cf. radiosum LEGE 06105 TaxID=945769 RepID=A0A8J7K2H7_9CYAN|nr:putative PEP-binding protein [Plectonema radiosum]MBE9213072.1 phosphoenolpyruvate synthase [Plectonema cf. radiosum LEGE 06105]